MSWNMKMSTFFRTVVSSKTSIPAPICRKYLPVALVHKRFDNLIYLTANGLELRNGSKFEAAIFSTLIILKWPSAKYELFCRFKESRLSFLLNYRFGTTRNLLWYCIQISGGVYPEILVEGVGMTFALFIRRKYLRVWMHFSATLFQKNLKRKPTTICSGSTKI